MSTLGDLIVGGGPYDAQRPIGDLAWRIAGYAEINALRDELMAARAAFAEIDRALDEYRGAKVLRAAVQAAVDRARGGA